MEALKVTDAFISRIYRPIRPDTHKGRQGHAIIVAGSYGRVGAAVLATRSCVKSGAGLVTAFIPECGYGILQATVPEAMVVTDAHARHLTRILLDIAPDAVGIGPGIGQEKATGQALHDFLKTLEVPLVVDADGLNLLSLHPEWLEMLPSKTILTPHQKELRRLIGDWKDEEEKLDKTISFSKRHRVVVVVKGASTLIVDEEVLYENTTGNAALATGGTGDCLTGILTGLLAQGYGPSDAAILGVFLHGRTADIAIPETGYEAFTAGMIPDYLGRAFLSLYGSPGDYSGI